MFVDEASITVVGGDGGNGCSSFRREKYVPRGGPDGGNGGHGGSVVVVADDSVSTLLEFRHHTIFRAERGRHGQGSNKTGRSGKDLRVRVPVGTVLLDEDGVRRLADLAVAGQRFVAAGGGRGGRGNATFPSPTNRAPTRCEPGQPGQTRVLGLELKLMADVGLLGFPNAGKSTLLARISAARPKIADYPFTTLEPRLGVVDRGNYRTFVAADIPGLIEGAHRGAGLGHRFLRHVERCRLLLHLVDPTDTTRDPVEGVQSLNEELRAFRADLARKPQILVLTKADAVQDQGPVEALRRHADRIGEPCCTISAVSGEGLSDLIREVGQRLDELRTSGRSDARTDTEATVGVLGGTFDPVHLGHLLLADHVGRALRLGRTLLLPAALPPHKPHGSLSPAHDRETMLRLAVRGREDLEVCTLELHANRVCYTVDTLRTLRDGPPARRLVFILGMDSLLQLTSWKDYRELLAEFDLAVLDRPGSRLEEVRRRLAPEIAERILSVPADPGWVSAAEDLQPGRGGRVFRLALDPIPVSSSEIRARAAAGLDLKGLVPASVARYIQETGLYRQEVSR